MRGHIAEYGVVAPNGPVHVERLVEALQDSDSGLPASIIGLCQLLVGHIASLSERIGLLEKELRERARRDETAKRLMTIPGIGVICATAMEALAPPLESLARGRDFAGPGSVSRHGKTLLAARLAWAEPRKWASAICAGSLSVAR